MELRKQNYSPLLQRRKKKKLGFLCLPQSQNNNVKFMCYIGTLFCMNSELRWIPSGIDNIPVLTVLIFPSPLFYQVWLVYGENPPSLSFSGHGCLFKLSPEHYFVSTQNLCHMDLWSAWLLLAHHHHFHRHQLPLQQNPTEERISLLLLRLIS
jgi:hypothetical protein